MRNALQSSCIGLLLVLTVHSTASAQLDIDPTSNYNRFQYGAGVKFVVELATKDKTPFNFRVAATAGVASDFIASWTHPSLNVECQLYSGGMGSRNNAIQGKPDRLTFDFITALTMTVGTRNRFTPTSSNYLERHFVPLSYFSNTITPALQNPFGSSLSLGTNIVWSSDPKRERQRVGFLGFNFFRTIQFTYYNDGGLLMPDIGLGDAKDRYFTGGGTLAYTGKLNAAISSVSLSYYKFTGYTLNSFEGANKMNLAYMDYKDEDQFFFNKSLYNLSFTSFKYGTEVNLRYYNSLKWDAQHGIHWLDDAAFHLVPYDSFPAIAVSYIGAYNKYGTR
ncbi:MAG: hypothetical protein REI78_13470 [Pedobacter sp.]|nr:hypothetical protein [Pedobacter sp.]MDQ8054038.1 hypothetical protein [Pedobacter sp.]